jgi:hypothetical protein
MGKRSMQAERWNWLEDGVMPLLLTLMRTAWLWPWLALIRAWFSPTQTAPVLPLAALILVPLLSFTLTRRLLPTQRSIGEARNVSVAQLGIAATGLIVLLSLLWWHFYRNLAPLWSGSWILALGYDLTYLEIELPVQIIALLAGIYLWLRGVFDGRMPIYHETVWNTFLAGVGLLALYIWLARFGAPAHLVDGTGWLLLFFACGMAGLAVTNLKTASGWSLLGGRSGRVQANRYWMLSILITIVGLLGLGLLLNWLIAPEEVIWILNAISAILTLIGRAISLVLTALSYIAFAVFYVLYWLLAPLYRWLQRERAEVESEPELAQPLPTAQPLEQALQDPASMPEPFRWIGLAIALLVIFVIFVIVLRRLRAAPQEEAEELRESIYSGDLLQDQLSSLWQRWRQRFAGGQGPGGPAFADLSGEVDTRRTIRAVYQRLLTRAAAQGHARLQAQTPLEYRPELERTWTRAGNALARITHGYVEARYAAAPPTVETARQVAAAWSQIEEDEFAAEEKGKREEP